MFITIETSTSPPIIPGKSHPILLITGFKAVLTGYFINNLKLAHKIIKIYKSNFDKKNQKVVLTLSQEEK